MHFGPDVSINWGGDQGQCFPLGVLFWNQSHDHPRKMQKMWQKSLGSFQILLSECCRIKRTRFGWWVGSMGQGGNSGAGRASSTYGGF